MASGRGMLWRVQVRCPCLALAAALVSCSSPTDIALDIPEGTEESTLVIVRDESRTIVVGANLPLETAIVFDGLTSEDGFVPVDLLLYETELETLGYRPGEIPLLSATDGGVPPPRPARVFRFTEDAVPPEPSAFEEVRPLPFLRRTANPCSDFSATAEAVQRGRPSHPPRLVRASDSTALLTLSDGRMFLVDDASAQEVSMTSTLATSSVFRAADGTFWFGGTTGQIWSGNLVGTELRDIVYHGSPRPFLIRHLSGGMSDDEMELFYLDGGTGWVRKHGGSHTLIQDGPLGFNGGVVWLGPGHALMAHDRSTNVFEYVDGEVGMITPSGAPRVLTGLSHVEGMGVFALGFEGDVLFREVDGAFETIGSSGIALNNLVAARFEDRILVGASAGSIAEWVPGFGFCQPQIVSANNVRGIVDIGRGEAILSADISGLNEEVTYTRIRRN